MPWFWTDDLARLLVESGRVVVEDVQDWMAAPVALAVPEGVEPLDFALEVVGSVSPQVA